MSVQVRRRREAAAFLATYVGAQGELLVDTTNNRVQVHDGATAGGWPAAGINELPGRNAGINTNGAVNQRNYVSGTVLAAAAYGHDRHKAGAGGCTYTFVQAVPDTSFTITAGTLLQAIDAPNIYANTYWLTWTGTSQARVWQGSASGAFASGTAMTVAGVVVNALFVSGLTIGQIANVEFSTGTLNTTRPWQFEAALSNAGPTRFERRHVGTELALCQRYFLKIVGAGGYEIQYSANAAAGNQNYLSNLTFPVTMRAVPTVIQVGTWYTSNCTFAFANPTPNTVLLVGTSSAAGFLFFANAVGAGFSASAEL